MKRPLRIFELSKNEQRVVLIIMLVLVTVALIRYERRVHRSPIQPTSATEAKPSPSPKERGLLYETDQAALAAELRKSAYDHRWPETQQGDNPTIFWPPDPAIPSALRILQPTSVAIFDDRIMFERGGPLHHFGIVVFRQSSPAEKSKDNGFAGEQLLKEFQPGVWFYSDHRKLPRP